MKSNASIHHYIAVIWITARIPVWNIKEHLR
jgi:hypothetical protein